MEINFLDATAHRIPDRSISIAAESGIKRGRRYIFGMCGRFTNKLTWDEIVRLYRLTIKAPPHNLPPRYNICPTDPVDVVTQRPGNRDFTRMRWGLVPSWWPKPLKELRAATFNARAETVAEKPFFREAFQRPRC